MKIFHIADLHIGKIVNGFSMLEEQKYVLNNILDAAEKENIDGIIIAGDIYDKSIPSVDAIDVFDDFVSKLSEKSISTYIVSGNHDSVQRVSFGSSIMAKNNIYFAKSYNGKIEPIMADDKEKIAIIESNEPNKEPAGFSSRNFAAIFDLFVTLAITFLLFFEQIIHS